MTILLDMDGVLTDMIQGAAVVFNKDYDELLKRWPPGVYEIQVGFNMSSSRFYKALQEHGEDFWANLPPYPYALDFYEYCKSIAPTYILSTPTLDPSSLSGKLRWLNKWFGSNFRNYIFTAHKQMCARHTHVLIDDRVSNVEAFREHGGQAILWPTPFNPRHQEAKYAVDVAKKELENLMQGTLLKNGSS